MNKSNKIIFILIILLFSHHLSAREKLKVAVLDFKAINVPAYYAGIVKSNVETYLVNKDDFIVLERSQVELVYQEMQLKTKGYCDTTACQVDAGRALSADLIIIGTVQNIAGEKQITIKIINVNNSKIVSANSLNFKNDKEIKKITEKTANSTAKNIQKFDITKQGVDRRYEVYVSASFNYAVPYMTLRSILSNGYGFNLNFGLKNDNFLFGLETEFCIFKGKGDYTQAKYFPILLNSGYNINIFNFLSVTPVIGLGTNIKINNFKSVYLQFQKERQTIGISPLGKAQINIDFSVNSFIKIQIAGGTNVFVERNKIFSFLDFKIGTMVIF